MIFNLKLAKMSIAAKGVYVCIGCIVTADLKSNGIVYRLGFLS